METLNVADATSLPSSATGGGSAVPEGTVPYRDSTRDAASPPVTPEKEPDAEAEEESVERVAKRARLDEQRSELRSVIKNLKKMTGALEKASGALGTTNSQMQANTAEFDRLAGQLGLDQAHCRWQLATLQTFTNKLESMEWQLSGGKRAQAPTLKEVAPNILKEMKQANTMLEQTKREARAQSDLLITHVKAMERALASMATSFSQLTLVTILTAVWARFVNSIFITVGFSSCFLICCDFSPHMFPMFALL